MSGDISLRWTVISLLIAFAVGLALTRLTHAAWAPLVAMGVLMGALIGVGKAMRRGRNGS